MSDEEENVDHPVEEADPENGEGEAPVEEEAPKPEVIDYDEMDCETGFKKVELRIWREFSAWRRLADEEKESEDEWVSKFAETTTIDLNRIKTVMKIGLFAGVRDHLNQRHGEGHTIYCNEDEYQGTFREGVRHGQGVYTYKSLGASPRDQAVFDRWRQYREQDINATEFNFCGQCKDEFGMHEICTSKIIANGPYPYYKGTFAENKKHGRGEMKYKDGGIYDGDWLDNNRHGQGTYYYPNGDVYTGMWAANKKHGQGTYELEDPSTQSVMITGEWENGEIKQGTWKLSNKPDISFTGSFAKNLPMGAGRFVFKSQNMVQEGSFAEAPLEGGVPVWDPCVCIMQESV